MRDIESDYLVGVILEFQQALCDQGIIQEIVLSILGIRGFAWCTFQFIVVAEVMGLEDLVHGPAPIAAK